MATILLTGAGFSRNWGGWLADEAFEYLLGSSHVDESIRTRLWIAKEKREGFEDVLAQLQSEYEARSFGQSEQEFRNLTNAITAMFAEMAAGYKNVDFDGSVEPVRKISNFLCLFDAIFTLNPHTLIEQKYAGRPLSGTRFKSCVPARYQAHGDTARQ